MLEDERGNGRFVADERTERLATDAGTQYADNGDSLDLGGRTEAGEERPTRAASSRARIPLLDEIREHERTSQLIVAADQFLDAQGFTEHGFRHALLVGHIAFNVLTHLGHERRVAELGAVSGYLHDIGNVVSRANHGQTSACWRTTCCASSRWPCPTSSRSWPPSATTRRRTGSRSHRSALR